MAALDQELLVDNTKEIYDILEKNLKSGKNDSIIDIVLDNAGYELFTDMCLATYLMEKKFTSKVRFYVKRYPWFVSDVMTKDFHWMIEEMTKSDKEDTRAFGRLAESYVKNGIWTVEVGFPGK